MTIYNKMNGFAHKRRINGISTTQLTVSVKLHVN